MPADFPIQDDYPRPPSKADELGIPVALVEDLFVRRLLLERVSTVHAMSQSLGIRVSIGQEVSDGLRDRHLVEYHGMEGRDYRVGLTENGTRLANERMQTCTYASWTPIGLAEYTRTIWAQKAEIAINRENIRAAFGDLVVADEMLDQLGPAFMNDGAIFLYGPPGTGKTSLAERMIRIHKDQILVPRAIEVDGQIITVLDPSVHKIAPEQPPGLDPRWVMCERPIVIVGGEMTMSMLELDYDSHSGTYVAPIQMQANNGILVVDDFGRQSMSPAELLNRWIVPLSRSVDFLKLTTGTKFTVPFELKLVASTNLEPETLGDDAFLRRLKNKVFVGPIEENAFNWILVRVAQAHGIEVTAEAAKHLRDVAIDNIGELRPYVAVDFLEMMKGIAAYEGLPSKLDRYMIDRVAQVYFFTDDTPPSEEISTSAEQKTAVPPAAAAPAAAAPASPAPASQAPAAQTAQPPAAQSPAAQSPAAQAPAQGAPAPQTPTPGATSGPGPAASPAPAPMPRRTRQQG